MTKDEEDLEYFLLRNYKNLGLTSRRNLTEMCFAVIENLETPNSFWTFGGSPEEQQKSIRQTRSIQLEIISKIMFLIEDMIIIAESLRQKRSYYYLLKEDVGVLVGNFIKNLDSLTFEELCTIMGYVIPTEDNTEKDYLELLQKHMKSNIDEIKSGLKMIGDFGKQHHPVFRRFKHAGVPALPGLLHPDAPDFLKSFDFHMLVMIGDDPLNDLKIIPYSKDVLEGYKIVFNSAQKIVYEMVDNRLACIQRKVSGLIPQDFYDITKYSTEELEKIKDKVEKFYKENPTVNTDFEFHSNPIHKKEDYAWYLNLEDFLKKCEDNANLQREYQEKLKSKGFNVRI